MKFTIEDSLESIIFRAAGNSPVEIISKNDKEYEIIGIPDNKKDEVRNKIKEYIESRGKIFNEIE